MRRSVAAFTGSAASVLSVVPRSPAWYELRQSGIGSSDAPAILGLNPWKTPLEVYTEKLGLAPPSQEDSEAAYWGRHIEPLVINRFRKETDRYVNRSAETVINKDRPWQLASLDAVQRKDRRKPFGVLEVKCTGLRQRWDDGVPDYVNAQVQQQLAVTGWGFASVAVLFFGNQFFWADVERNEPFIDHLIEVEKEFWNRVVELSPPPAGPTAADTKALQLLFPVDNGSSITLAGGGDAD